MSLPQVPSTTPPAAGVGVASSMALWTDLVDSALRSDYPEAIDAHDASARGRPVNLLVVAVASLIGIILVTAAIAVLRDRPILDAQRSALGDRIAEQQVVVSELEGSVRTLEAQVESVTRDLLSGDTQGSALVERLALLESATGLTEVTGPGVTVSLRDAEDGAELGIVLDRDLQAVVNGLWQAGARAVSINGIRLTSRTAIRGAGEAILVGYRPLAPPYRIDAVGADQATFADSGGGRLLLLLASDYGIGVDITTGQRVIPAAAAP